MATINPHERPYPQYIRVIGTTIPLLATHPDYPKTERFITVKFEVHQDNTIDAVPIYGSGTTKMPGVVRMTIDEYKSHKCWEMNERAKALWALDLCGWSAVEN